ncbi:DMT family transporter [Brevibacterium aurantiacum]|uniref:EamA domain-containing protein n=1 Tax=Brevibacterium aurantiacum TaxID=273384 RepID=A0A2A3ZA46_BREAU|nr:DMT family transporter [Brevibacterium aurantiacum]PCC48409.1 hypothetical protein CIK64_01600 [Brevibacterium aurantiacum]
MGGGLLAVGSSLVYGTSDFLGGMAARHVRTMMVLWASHLSALALLTLVVIVGGAPRPDLHFLGFAALAGIGEVVAMAGVYRGLATGRAAIVAPLGSLAPVVAVGVGAALGEVPTSGQLTGIAAVLLGVTLVSVAAPATESAAGHVGPSLMYGITGALGHGGFFLAMDLASEGGVAWALLGARITSVAVLTPTILATGGPGPVQTRRWPLLAGLGVLIVLGDGLYAVATTQGILGVVAVLSSLYPIVTIALTRIVLDEQVSTKQWIGAAIAVIGVAAVSSTGV